MKRIAVLLLAGLALVSTPVSASRVEVRIPRCAEDEPFLRGRGDFEDGHWSRYVCVHQDVVARGTALDELR